MTNKSTANEQKTCEGKRKKSQVIEKEKKKKEKEKKEKEKKQNVADVRSRIDEIFSKVRVKKKDDSKENKKETMQVKKSIKKKTPKVKTYPECKQVRRMDAVSGLPIYTLQELNIGQGKNTKDCPFDCDCCF